MKSKSDKKIIFVYNANSGTRNAILDSMHKVFSPATYACSLCDITYGIVSENKTWKKFRQEREYNMVFLHKDEFTKTYASKFGHKFDFPIVLFEGVDGLEVLIATQELNELKNANDLVNLVKQRTRDAE